MSLFRKNFHLTIILIFLYYLTFVTGHDIVPKDLEHDLQELEYLPPSNNGAWNPEADKEICLAVMRKYCGRTEWNFPTAEDCIRQAVLTWREDIIPEGVLKNYYLKFIEHRDNLKTMSKYMVAPLEFCHTKPIDEFEDCQEELAKFKKKPENALKFALLSTKLDEYCTIAKEGDTSIVQPTKEHAFDFMVYLRSMIVIFDLPYPIPNPADYCHTTCYNRQNERTRLDWTPYYNESVEDN